MNSIDNYDFKGKRAIIRVDFNVPLNEKGEAVASFNVKKRSSQGVHWLVWSI